MHYFFRATSCAQSLYSEQPKRNNVRVFNKGYLWCASSSKYENYSENVKTLKPEFDRQPKYVSEQNSYENSDVNELRDTKLITLRHCMPGEPSTAQSWTTRTEKEHGR
jgi:hypothetical protein